MMQEATFWAKCRECGITEDETKIMKTPEFDLTTLGKFAFACNYQPGASDDSKFIALVAKLTGSGASEPPPARVTAFRWLHFEAYTLAAAEMKATVEARGTEAPRVLALPERSVRYTEQQERMGKVKLVGEREISWALQDKVVAMVEKNALKYLPWSACTKRDAEVAGEVE